MQFPFSSILLQSKRCGICQTPLDREDRRAVFCRGCKEILKLRTSGFCPLCASLYSHEKSIYACGQCRQKKRSWERMGFYNAYEGVLKDMLIQYKFNGRLGLGRIMKELMHKAYSFHFNDKEIHGIIPVPLHTSRLKHRGFNQSLELAKSLAARVKVPLKSNYLVRNRATTPQSGLKRNERRENVKGVFSCRMDTFRGKNVLLVDDVATTGSTLTSCAKTLKKSGVHNIYVLVLAKAS